MGGKNAAEVFSSPGTTAAISPSGGAGLLANPISAGLKKAGIGIGPGMKNPFKEAAKEQDAKATKAYEDALKAQTFSDTSGTSNTQGTTESASQTTFAPASALEQAATEEQVANFAAQKQLIADAEGQIDARLGTQNQARDALGNVLSGDAFALSSEEQGRINNLRDADISASSNAVNELLNQRLAETSADAARRGIRGQAFTQLQGDTIGAAAQELNRATLDANRTAAGQALAMPGQRVGIQAQSAGQFANFSDLAQQQAIQNRNLLNDPVFKQQAFEERLKGGKTTTEGSTNQTTASSGKTTNTGDGAVGILTANAAAPGEKAAANAGGLGVAELILKGAGAAAKAGA